MKLLHIYLGGLNTDKKYWTITEIEEGKEVRGYAAYNVKIHVSSWTKNLVEINRWVLECKGFVHGPENDEKIKDLYEIKEKQV